MMLFRTAYSLAIPLALAIASQARAEESYLMNDDVVVSKVADSSEFLAYSKHTGVWRRHDFGANVKATPVLTGSTCVFDLSGQSIAELVGIDRQGNWRTTKLHTTAKACKPIVADTVACFLHDGRAYAFSPVTGTWDSIVATVSPIVGRDMALVKSGGSIAVFSAQTGRWAKSPSANEAE